jgi:4-hydroxy-tetrahydrodipicolinate reductase
MSERTRVAIVGAAGRMGRMLTATMLADPGIQVVGAIDRAEAPGVGQDIGTLAGRGAVGVTIGTSLADVVDSAQVVIEFSAPEASVEHAGFVASRGKAMVIGTTGLSEEHLARIRTAAATSPILVAPNMSLGVNVLLRLLPQITTALGEGYDIEIVESHHRGKKDAPSGTALKLGEVVAGALGKRLPDVAVHGRSGIQPRVSGEIGFHAIRAGANVGDHTVIYSNEGEQIEITHRAFSRETFALGAVTACKWIVGRGPGLYSMQDVVG